MIKAEESRAVEEQEKGLFYSRKKIKSQEKKWSNRKLYFILARIVRAKDTREGVEQEKVVIYSI
jgi:hypothetical protein